MFAYLLPESDVSVYLQSWSINNTDSHYYTSHHLLTEDSLWGQRCFNIPDPVFPLAFILTLLLSVHAEHDWNREKQSFLFAVFQDFRIKKLSGIDKEILRLNDVAFLLFIDNQLSLCSVPVLCS